MIESFLIFIAALATTFTLLTFIKWDVTANMMSIITWLVAAASSAVVDVPYQLYNSTDNVVVEGVQHITGAESYLAWLWFGFAVIMLVCLWTRVTETGMKVMR